MHSIMKTNGYQKIEYTWGQETKCIEGLSFLTEMIHITYQQLIEN